MAELVEWYVKTDDGNVYGPADLAKLVQWARDGRIEPSSFVSEDREKWTPAPLMRELGMKWIVETEFGKLFGPFHHDVVSSLINERRVPPDVRIFRLDDGEQEKGAVEVVRPEPLAAATVVTRKGSVFSGVEIGKLAVLEAAARKEMERARRQGVTIDLFGGKRK